MAKDYDPQMHTAEHVLNQSMVRLFGSGRSFSSHLNPGKSKCDYHFARDLAPEEAAELEAQINKILELDLPVLEELVPRREAEKLVNLDKLPASVGPDEPIRIVRVGDYDICPCIGAHVERTGQVGRFRLVSHGLLPRLEGRERPVLRLRFKIG